MATLVIRWMAAAHGEREILLTRDPAALGDDPGGRTFRVLDPEPGAVDPRSPARREAIVAAVREASRLTTRRMCVVFGPGDAVYVDPDGAVREGAEAPSGGLRLDRVRAVGRPPGREEDA